MVDGSYDYHHYMQVGAWVCACAALLCVHVSLTVCFS